MTLYPRSSCVAMRSLYMCVLISQDVGKVRFVSTGCIVAWHVCFAFSESHGVCGME